MPHPLSSFLPATALALAGCATDLAAQAQPWVRHTIDQSSRGADGVRMTDVNADGQLDIATGWEEGGVIRAYLHPGPKQVQKPWPAVTVGRVKSPEDAVFVDLDGDSAFDVVSSCEGKERRMFIHWAPSEPDRYLDATAWKTEAIPATKGKTCWMYALPLQVDGHHGLDLIVGSKNPAGRVAWLQAPEHPRKLDEWQLHEICPAGWIMSLRALDMDKDGDLDILASDRKGKHRGLVWLEHPEQVTDEWPRHVLGATDREVMFLDMADMNGDGLDDIVSATRNTTITILLRPANLYESWPRREIPTPFGIPLGKAVRIGDIDLDGKLDLVVTSNTSDSPGVIWCSIAQDAESISGACDISGPQGVKFDRIELYDLDQDGDLDVITCEERQNLGVIWYENPAR